MKPKLIIIDPSPNTPDTHNSGYNRVIAAQGRAAGHEVHLLVHKQDVSPRDTAKVNVHRVFSHTIYEHWATRDIWRDDAAKRAAEQIDKRIDRLVAQPVLSAGATDAQVVWHYARRALNLALAPVAAAAKAHKIRRHARGHPFYRDLFARQLAATLKRIGISTGDRLVIHTATFGQMESLPLLRVFMGLSAPLDVDCHCIFHHSPTAEDTQYWFSRYYQASEPRWLVHRLKSGSPFARIHLAATNAPLQSELSAILGCELDLFEHIVESVVSAPGAARPAPGDPLRIGVRASDVADENLAAILEALTAVTRRHPDVRVRVLSKNDLPKGTAALALMSHASVETIETTATREDYLHAIDGMDIFLLPHTAGTYARRVSGVLYDCLSHGKLVVVASGTTMASERPAAMIFPYGDETRIAEALAAAVAFAHGPDIVAARDEARDLFRARAERDVVADLFAADRKPAVTIGTFGPVATIVQPAWGRCGSSTVFDSETEYLLTKGFFVIRLLVAQWDVRVEATKAVYDLIEENTARVKPHAFALSSMTGTSERRARATPGFAKISALGQMSRMLGASEHDDAELVRFAFEQSEVVIVNHSFHGDYASAFRKAKRVLETQDIQALQYRIRSEVNKATGKPETLDMWIRDEIKIWQSFDACVNLSQDEDNFISRYARKSYFIRPFIEPRSLTVQRSWGEFVKKNGLHESFLAVDHFDMMLWGDFHASNIESTEWFLREVVLKYFKGRRIAILGRVHGDMYQTFGSVPGWYYGGFLDSLDDCFARSTLLVLPDRSGSGMSIKTLETMALGRPFVATDIALRGVAMGDARYGPTNSPEQMRADIEMLLNSPSALAERALVTRQLYEANFGAAAYADRWDRVLTDLGVSLPAAPPGGRSAPMVASSAWIDLDDTGSPLPAPPPPMAERHVTLQEIDHLPDSAFVPALFAILNPDEPGPERFQAWLYNVVTGVWSHYEAALRLATSRDVLAAGIVVDDLDLLSTELRERPVDIAEYVELSTDEQVRKGYREVLDKEADDGGFSHFVLEIESGKMTVVDVIDQLARDSGAGSRVVVSNRDALRVKDPTTDDRTRIVSVAHLAGLADRPFAEALLRTVLLRELDDALREAYIYALRTGRWTQADAARELAGSAEIAHAGIVVKGIEALPGVPLLRSVDLAEYPGLSNEGLVSRAYRDILDKEADAEGLAYYTGELVAGRMTALDLVDLQMADSEADGRVQLSNRALLAAAVSQRDKMGLIDA